MRICLAAYNHRLAALFDNASRLLLYDVDGAALHPAGEVHPPERGAASRVAAVLACGAEVLVCGALSRCTRYILSDSGLVVWDWVRGDIDEVLSAWSRGRLQDLSMPGCQRAVPCCLRSKQE
ncbi:NifB/NifX family molybdenum-iron cluster-binding protein [Desulfovermiculus halophilus]|jgi:predicted Fe-Mo cluster-binding NifX family protein|uniref:NifB/NifX family molybdenum-iron cluster-binding protein n=1 Tax=Desulfovermiculus halophilus TaxID=339722 RepID=UPI0006861823|nr:NifB/NifX family molybdenum-iron cluster-binding protein [Desulfovermiculus halophilus]